MKKTLLIAALSVMASFPAMAQFDAGTNSYDYGCGVGVPPSACGADGGSRSSGSSSNKSPTRCRNLVKIVNESLVEQYRKKDPNVDVKYIGEVSEVDNAYAFKVTFSKGNEIHFVIMGKTGEVYARDTSDAEPKFEMIGQQNVFLCRK